MTESLSNLKPGFYWICLGENPPEVALLHDGAGWLCGRAAPWPLEGAEVLSERLVVRPALRSVPTAGE